MPLAVVRAVVSAALTDKMSTSAGQLTHQSQQLPKINNCVKEKWYICIPLMVCRWCR